MRLIATTVVRESLRGRQRTGYIYDVDWDSGRVLHRLPVPEPRYPESDDNPRGGVRGGRGVAATREGILVANYDTLLRYDDDWRLLNELSHPLFVGIHEIDWDGEVLWVAATGIDAVLEARLDGSVKVAWDPHTSDLSSRLGLRTRRHPIDGSIDYRIREAPLADQCHLNGVARHDGALLVNLGLVRESSTAAVRLGKRARARLRRALGRPRVRPGEERKWGKGVVVEIARDGSSRVLVELSEHAVPTHNGQLLDASHVAVNDSTTNTLRIFSTKNARPLAEVPVPGTWLRGLEPLDARRVLVGTAPASIVLVNLDEGRIERTLQLSTDANEAVHGLAVCAPLAERR